MSIRRDYFLLHRACAAFLAISLRCSFVSFLARASPPFLPPSRPSATAAGFLPLGGGWTDSSSGSVTSCSVGSGATGCWSSGFFLLERLGILLLWLAYSE